MDYIDIYCERLAPGLWAEPLNALTNLAFFIAAGAAWHLARRQQSLPISIVAAIGLIIAIAIGSTLFHTFATSWAILLDVIPILLFQIYFIWVYSRQAIALKSKYSAVLIVVFLFACSFSTQFKNVLNGSLSYAPVLLILAGFGIYHYKQEKRERFLLLAAAGVFLFALFFRSIDSAICPYFSIGTHFLWHIFNGVLLYLLMRGLILNWKNTGKSSPT